MEVFFLAFIRDGLKKKRKINGIFLFLYLGVINYALFYSGDIYYALLYSGTIYYILVYFGVIYYTLLYSGIVYHCTLVLQGQASA